MLAQILGMVDEKSDSILGEKRLEKVMDFLNGFEVGQMKTLSELDLGIMFD